MLLQILPNEKINMFRFLKQWRFILNGLVYNLRFARLKKSNLSTGLSFSRSVSGPDSKILFYPFESLYGNIFVPYSLYTSMNFEHSQKIDCLSGFGRLFFGIHRAKKYPDLRHCLVVINCWMILVATPILVGSRL